MSGVDYPLDRALALPDIDFGADPLYDIHALMAELRERGRFFPVRCRSETALLVTRFDDVRAGFDDEEAIPLFASARKFAEKAQGRSLFSMTGEEHRLHRALVSAAFTSAAIDRYERALMMPEVARVLDRTAARAGTADLVHDFTEIFPISVIVRILGMPPEDDRKFKQWAEELVSYDWQPEVAMKASREFEDYLLPVIEERRSAPGEDVISRLATATVEGKRLGDIEIVSFLRILFPAGADTTFRALGNLILAVLRNDALRARLAGEPRSIPDAVDEILRWEPPIGVYPRFVPNDVVWRGAFIPADTRLLLGVASANRDPRAFDDPDRFELERRAKRITSFGGGIHYCIGALLAKREMTIGLQSLLARFPNLDLAEGAAPRIAGPVLRGPEALPVRLG
ncbi:MAG TPA: cytochrome P450 [Alphaproteobacteria bacterium]|nr:cytochrome P450 [Alphaproteobacteria bacterium]